MSAMDPCPSSPRQAPDSQHSINGLALTSAIASSFSVKITLPTFTDSQDRRFSSISLTGLDEATSNANLALLSDRDARTTLNINGHEASLFDPNELLDRMVHCRRIGGNVFDDLGNEITRPEEFVAGYSRALLTQLQGLNVFNVARHCVFDISTRRATYNLGFNASFDDLRSKDRIVWVDAVLKRDFRFLHNSASGYILQRICAAAMLQKPKSAANVADENSSRRLAVTKLPFPLVKNGLLYLPEAHIAAGEGVIFTVRSSRVARIDNEYEQFLTGNVTTSGCIIEYLVLRACEGMKNARELFWSEIRRIEAMQDNPLETRGAILKRIAVAEDVASNLVRTAGRVAERLRLERVVISDLYPGLNFADKWLANWIASTNGLTGIGERLKQERSQIEAQIQSEEASKSHKAAEASRRSTNLLTYAVTTAGIIQALSFTVGDGASLAVRATCAGIVAAGVAVLSWLGLRYQSTPNNGNGPTNK